MYVAEVAVSLRKIHLVIRVQISLEMGGGTIFIQDSRVFTLLTVYCRNFLPFFPCVLSMTSTYLSVVCAVF